MKNLRLLILSMALCCAISTTTSAQSINFSDDFEAYVFPPDGGLLGGGWLVGANVWNDPNRASFAYNYFAFDAPNGNGAFTTTDSDGGNIVFNTFSDYNNGDHGNGLWIDARIFNQANIMTEDIDLCYRFTFDHQLSPNGTPDAAGDANIAELAAWIAVLDPVTFAQVYFDSFDTSTAASFTTSSIDVTIDPAWDGFIIQWGFLNYATGFAPTGVWYDNVSFAACPPEPPVADAIPTMGEWGLMCLSIMLLIFGVIAIRQRQIAY